MNLARYLSEDRIIEIKSDKKEDALMELVRQTCRSLRIRKTKMLYQTVMEREEKINSKITDIIAMPHATYHTLREYSITLGISRDGIEYYSTDGKPAHIILLLLSNGKNPKHHLAVLRQLAQMAKDPLNIEILLNIDDKDRIIRLFQAATSGDAIAEIYISEMTKQITHNFMLNAFRIARNLHIPTVFIYTDVFEQASDLMHMPRDLKIILVTKFPGRYSKIGFKTKDLLEFPFREMERSNQIKTALLIAVSRRMIEQNDLVMFITGETKSGLLDTIRMIDIQREFSDFLIGQSKTAFGNIKKEVLVRSIQLAMQIADEGREGKALGTIFVLGDDDNVQKFTRQLVLNPFMGYPDHEKNILDPNLEETVKEYATIDGAFIIRGDGIIISAGAYLLPDGVEVDLPRGLGTRHQAAAAITAITQAVAVAISQSTRSIRVFKSGKIITEL